MWRYLRNITSVIFLIIVLVFVFLFFLDKYSSKTDDSFESLSSAKINSGIKIYRNSYGIPHIIAQNEFDAFFAAGYCQAQDRLWQMDYLRRIASGRVSEIFGKDAVVFDKFAKVMGFRKTAESIYNSMDLKSREILKKYSEGVNLYIDKHRENLSFEFGAVGDTVEYWHPVDCISITRLMAFEMSYGFWADIAFGEMASVYGEGKAMELIPGYPDDAPFITDSAGTPPKSVTKSDFQKLLSFNHTGYGNNKELFRMFAEYSINSRRARDFWGMKGSLAGSNSWAVKKPFKDSSRIEAILANDPHLVLGLPAKWYQVHISCPEFNVVGLSIPGMPFVIIGRNDFISWGITNVMLDDCDFFIVRIDSANKDLYLDESNVTRKFKYIRDTIKVKDSQQIEFYIRHTERSAVISDFHLFGKPGELLHLEGDSSKYLSKYCLVYSWLGNEYSNESLSAYYIMLSKNWAEFKSSLSDWGVPALNFTYADIYGNIGISPSGMLPMRNKNNPDIPAFADNPECFWIGVARDSALPDVFNPPKNYVLSANNSTARNLPYHVTSYWEPPARAERINELLSDYMDYRTGYSARDAQIMQNDFVSPFAKKFLSIALPVIQRNSKLLNKREKEALALLQKWDFLMSKQLPVSAIFNMLFERMVFNTFYDNMGEYLYREYTFLSNIPTRKIIELMEDNNIYWFDNLATSRRETRDYIIFKSFRDAMSVLVELFENENIETWQYGKMHTLTLKHPMSASPLLDKSLSIGPLECSGSNTTINCNAYDIFEPFEVKVGASARFIADMSANEVYTIIPGGSSGSISDRNYGDQVQLWLNGGYIKLTAGRNPGSGFTLMTEITKD